MEYMEEDGSQHRGEIPLHSKKNNKLSSYIHCWAALPLHVIGVCLPSQSAPEKDNQKKMPIKLCAPREFLIKCVCHV